MSARAWRYRKDGYYRLPSLDWDDPWRLAGLREGHPGVFDRRLRSQLLRRDRRAARFGTDDWFQGSAATVSGRLVFDAGNFYEQLDRLRVPMKIRYGQT